MSKQRDKCILIGGDHLSPLYPRLVIFSVETNGKFAAVYEFREVDDIADAVQTATGDELFWAAGAKPALRAADVYYDSGFRTCEIIYLLEQM